MTKVNLLNFKISTTLDILDNYKQKIIINTINPHSYHVSKNDSVFLNALHSSDVLLPDGVGIVWAIKFLKGIKIKRITGADLHEFLLKKLNKIGGKVFYLGSSIATLKKIEARLKLDHPNVLVSCYSPPFSSKFTKDEVTAMINAINSFQPDYLFVGMTAPKQEKWVYAFQKNLNVKVICSIGAVFDFYAGNIDRAPKFMMDLGLEWLHRSIKSFRLLKRNFISNPIFLLDIIKTKFLK